MLTIPTVRHSRRRGFSLLEVVMAGTLASVALVGSLTLLRDAMVVSETIDDRLLMTNYAVSKLEEQLSLVASNWTTGATSGNFAADGHHEIRFMATRSDSESDGGLEERLMHIQVTTYIDADGNGVLGSSEKRCTFRTKVGKLASYEELATP